MSTATKDLLSARVRGQLDAPSEICTAFEEAALLTSAYGAENVFNLCIGNPEIPAPPEVAQAIEAIAAEDAAAAGGGAPNPYGSMCDAGFPEVRAAVADRLNGRYGTAYTQENVIMTAGTACGMNIVLGSILDPGDEVIVFAPYDPAYRRFIENFGGRMVTVATPAPSFQPSARALARAIRPRTKAVIVNSPNNPTGTIYSAETLQAIGQALEGTGVLLLSDEPYRDLVFDGAQVPYPALFCENTVSVYSFGTSLSIPGERIGYAVVPDTVRDAADLRRALRATLGNLGYMNAPAFFQRVVARCLDARVDLATYDRNRTALVDALLALGFKVNPPRGGFYLFLKTPCPEAEFIERALGHNLVMVGGSAFGLRGYARISLCVRHETILAALPAFAALADELGLTPAPTDRNGLA